MSESKTLREISCADDYDPNSMPVERARELIRTFLVPVAATERIHIRASLGRILAIDVRSPVAVPGHDNSAMDGYAVRFRDLAPDRETVLARVGESFAGKPSGAVVGAGQCVRIFTGGVMPQGADTVVMQERAREEGGRVSIAAGAVAKEGANRRFAGEDLKPGQLVFRAGDLVHPAELGMMASLGIGEITVFRRLRVAFFSTGDELKSIGTALGGRRDLRQQPLHDLRHAEAPRIARSSTWAWCRDDPEALERAFGDAAAAADVVITSGGVSVGEADFVQRPARQARRGAVLEDRDEAGPSARLRPDRRRAFLRTARQSRRRDGDVLRVRAATRCCVLQGGATSRRCRRSRCRSRRRSRRRRAAPSSSAASWRRTATAASPCAPPAIRAPASCRRWRRRTASSCCPRTP